MAASSWTLGHGNTSVSANLADPCYSLFLEHMQYFLKCLYSPLSTAANAEQSVILPVSLWVPCPTLTQPGLWTGWMSCVDAVCLHACRLFSLWHLSEQKWVAWILSDEKGKTMHVIGLISGCLVQVISPLDGSFVFLLVLVPLYKGK